MDDNTINPQQTEQKKSVVVSGMRSTGFLHLGHYHGVLKNWQQLQQKYRCYFFIADWHAITTHYADEVNLKAFTIAMVKDWLACGIEPNQSVLFAQSQVKQQAELAVLLGMVTPLSWLERVPTYKDQIQKLANKDLLTQGFLSYPLLQAADILAYGADFVPVGEDQVSHIELTREIARRFNFIFSPQKPLLSEPKVLLTQQSKMVGLDGQKMSKSYANTISLTDDTKQVKQKIMPMPTDPARVKRTDKGDPQKCAVFSLHQVYSNQDTQAWVRQGCTQASIGCVDCKKPLITSIGEELEGFEQRRKKWSDDDVLDLLNQGGQKARQKAEQTLVKVRQAIGLFA